ncbi:MAG: hypothetical protein MHPDNHAH_02038 [Anaerolineales bacterium]|nr:hypothetical protein [Anaerolineales bacterium]
MNVSNKNLRNILRAAHLVIGVLTVMYVYSPLGEMMWFGMLVKATVLPILVLSGLAMWQMPTLTKFLKRQSAPIQ